MGLLRKVVGKVVGKVRGGGETRRTPATPPPSFTPRPAESEPPLEAETLQSLECGAQELKERLDCGEHVVIVDVRTDGELRQGMLPGALHIPLQDLSARWEELKDADEIVLYCAAGMRSLQAAEFLRGKGLINATSLEGGVGAWRAAGGSFTQP